MATRFEGHKKMKEFYSAFKGKGKNKIFSTMWDVYYLSFLIGLSAKKYIPEYGMGETFELNRDMANYAKKKYHLIALLLVYRSSQKITDTYKLQALLEEHVDSEGKTLNEKGFDAVNQYAYWGFEHLISRISPNPKNAGIVFEKIYKVISANFKRSLS